MMDYTDRFFRYLLRQLTTRATLYTEMVTANTLVHCADEELDRFLGYSVPAGGRAVPLVLQVGGADPELLRAAAARAAPWGYSAINLNCGCPSDRVAGSGCFGAALMSEPGLVAECAAALAEGAGGVPVSVKCRVGIARSAAEAVGADPAELADGLARFVDVVAERGGVRHFAVHARQAVLGGLSPADNRRVPPLHTRLVRDLAADLAGDISISLNGGVQDVGEVESALAGGALSGVMVGRAVIAKPWAWASVDSRLYGDADPALSRRAVLDEYAAFAEAQEAAVPQRIRRLLLAPITNFFAAEPNGKRFRCELDARARDASATVRDVILGAAEASLSDAALDAPPGAEWDSRVRRYREPDEQPGAPMSADDEPAAQYAG